ncbi:MAG: alpha/beta hydrolase [Synechocystis sp.]|nr:alpha/beta hydrolase [Synechocystis sp.]
MIKLQHIVNRGIALGVSLCLPQLPGTAAENVVFSLGPLGDFYVSVKSLETFAATGKVTPDLDFYTKHLKADELAKFRDLLNQSFPLNSVEMFEFLNTSFGKEVVKELSTMINAPQDQSQPFLRGAMIEAAENPKGFKIIDVINHYGASNLVLNIDTFRNTLNEADNLYQATDRVFTWLDQKRIHSPSPDVTVDLSTLDKPGKQTWTSETLTIPRPNNQESLTVFVYVPKTVTKPAPLVVISPGLNSDFQAFKYIAEHLASYGFATAGINFPESDAERMKDALQGLDTFPNPNAWMNQPKDVTLVLDTLAKKEKNDPQWQGKFDTNNVGILGHSLGGYTATATGGAEVQWQNVLKYCAELDKPDNINLNPALLWQCQGTDNAPPLPELQDERIKAIIAINPVTNPAFGNEGINQIDVPMMFIAGSADIFAPPLPEQIMPFSAIDRDDKYLLLVQNSTHLSFAQGTKDLPPAIVGEGQELAYDYIKAISLAFFNLYLSQDSQFAPYLTDAAVEKMSKEPLPMHLIRSLTPEQLDEALKTTN